MIPLVNAMQEMTDYAFAAWKLSATTVLGSDHASKFRVQGVEGNDLPDSADYWARLSFQIVHQGRANLGALMNGSRRYETLGFLWIEVYAPKSGQGAFFNSIKVASEIRKRFVGAATPGQVRFKNDRVDPRAKQEGQWVKVDFWTEFEFDEQLANGSLT